MSCFIKGNRISLLSVSSAKMHVPVGYPLSDEFALLFHCQLLFTTEL